MKDTLSLCWFCGQRCDLESLEAGMSVGNMVYSSPVVVAWDRAVELRTRIIQADIDQVHRDGARICQACLREFLQESVIDNAYRAEMDAQQDALIGETCYYDTGLLAHDERIYSAGCWFESYPDMGVRKKYWSKSLIELYERGFRFTSKMMFGKPELMHFIDRYSQSLCASSVSTLDAFESHMREMLIIVNEVLDTPTVSRLAMVCPCIFNISVHDRWNKRMQKA